jgi:hypothetical protein
MLLVAGLRTIEWRDDRGMVIWKAFGRKRPWSNRGAISEFAWRNWRRPRELSVRIAEIRTQRLRNTNQENCRYTIPFSGLLSCVIHISCSYDSNQKPEVEIWNVHSGNNFKILFWVMIPYPWCVVKRFGGIYCLHLDGSLRTWRCYWAVGSTQL